MNEPDFFSDRAVKARAEYACHHCQQAIRRGTVHVSVSSRSSGRYHSHRAHQNCHAVAIGCSLPGEAVLTPRVESFA